VIVVGISHLPRNECIFSAADIAVGIDTLSDAASMSLRESSTTPTDTSGRRCVRASELEFVSAIASHSCAFRFHGASSIANISSILATSRAALEAASAAGVFVTASCVAFSLFVLLSACTPATAIVAVPTLGSVLFLQIFVPLLGFAIAMSDAEPDCMKRVPPKNDVKVTFSRQEGWRLYGAVIAKAIPTAVFPQLLYLIALGQFTLYLDPELAAESCAGASTWAHIIRCPALRSYSGAARTGAGAASVAHFALNVAIGSASFVSRFSPIRDLAPWQHNAAWLGACGLSVALVAVYMGVTVPSGAALSLPWYYFVYAIVTPFLCLLWNEYWKVKEAWHDRRAEKLRRLQFETRLGAWSPK
jgi:magnesium-transporting ATPase (P-type)